MAFDWSAPIPWWNKQQKPYIESIGRFKKNEVLKKLAKKYDLKKFYKRLKDMVRNYELEYLDQVLSALDKLISCDKDKHKIMRQLIENVRRRAERNIREPLEISWQ